MTELEDEHPSSGPGDAPGASAERAQPRRLTVPLLPLVDGVVFPSTAMPLTLRGEQASSVARAALMSDCLVALFMQHAGSGAHPTAADLHQAGTLTRLSEIRWETDGSVSVTAEGLEPVRLIAVTSFEPHANATVETLSNLAGDEAAVDRLAAEVRSAYVALLSRDRAALERITPDLDRTDNPDALAYVVASTLPISPAARQSLLEAPDTRMRLEVVGKYVHKALELAGVGGAPADTLERGALPSTPAEQASADRVALDQKLQEAQLPPEAMDVARRELDRLAFMSPISPEYAMLRTYIQWLADLPWSSGEERPVDLSRARAVLDRDHHGLEEIKTRIIEHLAVRKLRAARSAGSEPRTGEEPHHPVLCLVGPPGVGKTSLGRSIAAALDRPFVRFSLAGLTDEAEVKGHRRTYAGAMPGRIMQALARTRSSQPVVVLDELDKLTTSTKGDPTPALLDVLDPVQQCEFVDSYIAVPFDISRVFFVATANTLDSLPDALRDRLEVIRISGYTEEEKLNIALKHLVPRQMEWHALSDRDLAWTPEGILYIIGRYTREAGVRQLDREIATICRRVATMVASSTEGKGQVATPFRADEALVGELLGTPRFLPSEPEETDQPGVVTGVFWTATGGDIMHIEALVMPGSKHLTITGQLGDVMRESAQTAVSYVRARAADHGYEANFFEDHDIHLHIPSGAVAKDGPSAGVGLAVALLSLLLGKPVPADLAITGEITLRGKVLPVGGIKEKLLAARRAGLTRVIIPAQNTPDLDSLGPDVLDGLEVIPVSTMYDVLTQVFD